MITNEVVEATQRVPESRGKNEARRVRVTGSIPAVVYGAKKDSVAITVNPKQISKILNSESGHNTIFDLQIGSAGKEKVMIVDWQYDPIRSNLLHIDLKRIDMSKTIRVSVPISLVGESAGVKQQGGIMDQVLREVEIECLPTDIPSHIDVDVSELVFGQVIRVKDLPHVGKLKFITDEDQAVAHITTVKEEVVATPDAVAVEGATPAEPEVIKKGKQDAEVAPAEAGKKEK
ncbi:MAG TPA: 50S ribosomal protein L25 [Terriglobales bacterium]|nr:50S ribosomal protein L25 [Terriglobales bacterium]